MGEWPSQMPLKICPLLRLSPDPTLCDSYRIALCRIAYCLLEVIVVGLRLSPDPPTRPAPHYIAVPHFVGVSGLSHLKYCESDRAE